MLNPVTFMVEGESGPLEVTASGPDYAAYEDAFDRSVVLGMSEGRYKCWAYLVWHAMHRTGTTSQSFDEFLGTTPQFSRPEKVEDVPPLESQAPTG